MDITKSNEDYLEAILLYEKENGTRSIDVAKFLGVSKPAVTIAVKELIAKDLATKESYQNIILTDVGRAIANKTLSTHKLLRVLYKHWGISDECAEDECCKIEHILSDETIDCLRQVVKKYDLQKN